jgi:hypothetical protein
VFVERGNSFRDENIFTNQRLWAPFLGNKLGLEFKYGANPVLGVDQVDGGGARAGRLSGGE